MSNPDDIPTAGEVFALAVIVILSVLFVFGLYFIRPV